MLDKGTLVLEGVTLAQMVKLVVEVLVDLAGSTVLHEQAAEDTETTHPHNLTVVPEHQLLSFQSQIRFYPRICSFLPNKAYIFLASFAYLRGVSVQTYDGIRASAVPFLLPKPR